LEWLGIIAADHELVAKLRKQGFDAFPGFSQHWVERCEVKLVEAHWEFQPDGGGVELILLVLLVRWPLSPTKTQ
jgi:hypothetical protein